MDEWQDLDPRFLKFATDPAFQKLAEAGLKEELKRLNSNWKKQQPKTRS